MGIAFPPLPTGGLAFGALVPLLWVLEQAPTLTHLVRVGYVFGFCFHGAANWWVSSWQAEADPYLLVAGVLLWLGHPLFFLLPLLAVGWLARHLSPRWAVRCFPLFWVAFEWLHSLGEIGYPWLLLGYTQAQHQSWIQIADLAGVWGASFLVLWVNVAAYELLRSWSRARVRGESFLHWLRQRATIGMVVLAAALVSVPMLYGMVRLHQLRSTPVRGLLRAILVQPDFNPWAKWEAMTAVEQIQQQQRLTDSLLHRFPAELVVWNETAIPVPITAPEYRWLWESLRGWVRQRGCALLSGFAEMQFVPAHRATPLMKPVPWDSTRFYEAYNAVLLLSPAGELAGVHRKVRLTPFAERFPYAELLGRLPHVVEWGVGISSWAKGSEQRLLRMSRSDGDTLRIGVAICIESIFPDFARAYARQGGQLLVVVSNDAWFDHTPGPAQHFAIARVRAIELRRPLLRCANSGITAAVLPTGEVVAELPQYVAAALPVVLPLGDASSLYERIGDLLPQGAAVLCGVLLLGTGVRQAVQRKIA
ncbi:Apolipoprotein N-acyltransferase [bacterium HR21]|nr:Apolipoprotein N-acyltransferase [bacterium HR21]